VHRWRWIWYEREVEGKELITSLAGLSTAYSLSLAGKKVVVLEAREVSQFYLLLIYIFSLATYYLQIISGESGRTTAHIMTALDDRFYRIKKFHSIQVTNLTLKLVHTHLPICRQREW
jgi:glycine/D-amino acid oxidase-like deaminating enzyme